MIDGAEAGERFSLVEHPMSPRALAAPLHRHTREDEYSYVLEGRMGALLGDDVVEAGPGDLVFKPRNQWHTFWNAGDEPCRILEIISPAGFERFFQRARRPGRRARGRPRGARRSSTSATASRCSRRRVPELLERFGLRIGEPLSGGWTPNALAGRGGVAAAGTTATPGSSGTSCARSRAPGSERWIGRAVGGRRRCGCRRRRGHGRAAFVVGALSVERRSPRTARAARRSRSSPRAPARPSSPSSGSMTSPA